MKTNIVIVVCPNCKSDEILKRFISNGASRTLFIGFRCLSCDNKFNKKEAEYEDISAEVNYSAQ